MIFKAIYQVLQNLINITLNWEYRKIQKKSALQKVQQTYLLGIATHCSLTEENLTIFSMSATLQRCPPHLRYVATLPLKVQNEKKVADSICNKLL